MKSMYDGLTNRKGAAHDASTSGFLKGRSVNNMPTREGGPPKVAKPAGPREA